MLANLNIYIDNASITIFTVLTMKNLETKPTGRAKGAIARRDSLSPERRSEIAQKAALARHRNGKLPIAIRRGNFKENFGLDVDCYVLDDETKTAVISQRGMSVALGMGESGSKFQRLMNGKVLSNYVEPELRKKIENPVIFQSSTTSPSVTVHGYDVLILIEVCNAICKASSDGVLIKSQLDIAKQANIIVNATAKLGIRGLVYALAGYKPEIEEVIAAFKVYVTDEAKKYEKEFPTELYIAWARLYGLPSIPRGKSWKNKHLTIDHVYHPLAKSDGKLLALLREAKENTGERSKKLFQFLNEVGARALRMHMGRLLEMAETSKTKEEYESKIVERFGGQQSMSFE